MKIELNINEVELTKINLKPGDVLLAKVDGKDFEDERVVEALMNGLKDIFPNNQIGVINLSGNHLDFVAISQETNEVIANVVNEAASEISEGCATNSYCSDCYCGKKDAALAQESQKQEECESCDSSDCGSH